MQITIEIPDAIVQRIQPHWTNLAQKLLELLLQSASQAGLITTAEADAIPLEPSIELTPDQKILQEMDRQALLYEQPRNELLTRYKGQYIAMFGIIEFVNDPDRYGEAIGSRSLCGGRLGAIGGLKSAIDAFVFVFKEPEFGVLVGAGKDDLVVFGGVVDAAISAGVGE
jgi:hypothetical protein